MQTEQLDIVSDFMGVISGTPGVILPREAAKIVEATMRIRWGGQEAYVKKTAVAPEERARVIRAEYNGRNRRELQATWGLSRAQFYKILKGC